jgi:hypothetical protein
MFAVGFITAFIVALIAIKTFLQLIKRISFIPFAIYRFIVACGLRGLLLPIPCLSLLAEGNVFLPVGRLNPPFRQLFTNSGPLNPASTTSFSAPLCDTPGFAVKRLRVIAGFKPGARARQPRW